MTEDKNKTIEILQNFISFCANDFLDYLNFLQGVLEKFQTCDEKAALNMIHGKILSIGTRIEGMSEADLLFNKNILAILMDFAKIISPYHSLTFSISSAGDALIKRIDDKVKDLQKERDDSQNAP